MKRRKKKQGKKTLVSLEMLMELCRVELPQEFMRHAGFLNVLQEWYGLLAWSKSGAKKEFVEEQVRNWKHYPVGVVVSAMRTSVSKGWSSVHIHERDYR